MKKLLFAIMFMVLHTFSVSELFANDSYSPLFKAIQEDDLNKVRELIASGADVNERRSQSMPRYNYARYGEDANEHSNQTPLMLAVGLRKYNIVKELVKNGANINETFTCERGYYYNSASNVFFQAISNRDIEMLQILVAAGGNINLQDEYGTTPLLYSIRNSDKNVYHCNEYIEIIKKLIDLGADVNLQDSYGDSPITKAIHDGGEVEYEILDILLDAGADVNIKTPYMIYKPRVLDESADGIKNPYIYDKVNGMFFDKGITPLLVAVSYKGRLSTIEYIDILLSHGAQINAKDSKGRNAIICTMYSDTLLLQYDIEESLIKTINKLLTLNININDKDGFGRTALHYACFTKSTHPHGDPENKNVSTNPLIKMLLDSGADINAQDNDGKTALMLASEDDKADTVSYLLELGANPHIKDKNGKTALDLAREQKAVDAFWALKSYYQ